MSKISVTTIAGLTSGGDANKVKIEDGDTLEIVNGSQTINRTGNGVAQTIQNGGTTVGQIGVNSTDNMYFVSTNTGFKLGKDEAAVIPAQSGGSNHDNALDLGFSTVRWKDLYLSGGLKIGGTGAANTLDDYEEGTWTATYGSSGSNTGVYTKIGRLVNVHVILNNTNQTISSGVINGLPFAVDSSLFAGSVGRIIGMGSQNRDTIGLGATGSFLQIHNAGGGANAITTGGGTVRFDLSVTYFTTA